MNENPGMIARFRQQQALEEEAAQLGLYGTAMVASHAMITARMERGADYILRLIEIGKLDEAKRLMDEGTWDIAELEA
ncbi:MAG TPA: hypothetical protein VKU38_21580 [Ktedonobacteraceae bacterium]|nr:hypothetical protein [Ktedonobacteraceae bacterium]